MKVAIAEYELNTGIILSIYRDGAAISINGQIKNYDLLTFRQVNLFMTGDVFEVRISTAEGAYELIFKQLVKAEEKQLLATLNRYISDFRSLVNQFDKTLENKLIKLLDARLLSYNADRLKNLGRVALHDYERQSELGHLLIYEPQLMAFISYFDNSKILTPEPKYYGLEYEPEMAWDDNTPFPGTLFIDHDTAFSVCPDTMDEICRFYEKHNRRHHLQGPQGGKGTIVDVDLMNDEEFERFIISLFFKMGYKTTSTRMAGEFGVNLIASKNGNKIGIQAKCNVSNITQEEIQLLRGGLNQYQLGQGLAITNMYFTAGAVRLADTSGIVLWNRDVLRDKIYELGT
ncbi:MAG: restriction endonuclease [Syntrophomonadaceae bacterium]